MSINNGSSHASGPGLHAFLQLGAVGMHNSAMGSVALNLMMVQALSANLKTHRGEMSAEAKEMAGGLRVLMDTLVHAAAKPQGNQLRGQHMAPVYLSTLVGGVEALGFARIAYANPQLDDQVANALADKQSASRGLWLLLQERLAFEKTKEMVRQGELPQIT